MYYYRNSPEVILSQLYKPEEPEDRFILFSFPNSLAILCRPSVGVFFVVEMSTRHSPATRILKSKFLSVCWLANVYLSLLPPLSWFLEPQMEALVAVVERLRLEGEGPPVEADTVPAVDKKPFINLRSFWRFFFPPGPDLHFVKYCFIFIREYKFSSFLLFFCWAIFEMWSEFLKLVGTFYHNSNLFTDSNHLICQRWAGLCQVVGARENWKTLKRILFFPTKWFTSSPEGPEALCVFIPEARIISIISNLKAEMSFLISLTSSSVTPSFSAFRCSWVTYLRTRFLMIA